MLHLLTRAHRTRPGVARRRWTLATFASLAATAALAASSATATAATSSTSRTASATATSQTYPVTNFREYVGGTAGKANPRLSPIDIGWVNQQGGSADEAPEATAAAEFSVDYINTDLGGIDGHPLRLVQCYIPDTVASADECGQEMANNTHVDVVALGPISIGNESLETAIEPTHKPILFGISLSDVDNTYRPGLLLFGDTASRDGPFATFLAQNLHAKSVAIVYEQSVGNVAEEGLISQGLALQGVKTIPVAVDPSDTDFTAPLEAAGAATAGAIFGEVSQASCVDLEKALVELNITTPVVTSGGGCISPFASAGQPLPRWYFGISTSIDGNTADPSGASFNAVARKFGLTAVEQSDNWYTVTFSQILTIAKFMNEIGPSKLSPHTMAAKMRYFKGPLLWGPPQLICGTVKTALNICLDTARFYQPNTLGQLVGISKWLSPPKGLSITAL